MNAPFFHTAFPDLRHATPRQASKIISQFLEALETLHHRAWKTALAEIGSNTPEIADVIEALLDRGQGKPVTEAQQAVLSGAEGQLQRYLASDRNISKLDLLELRAACVEGMRAPPDPARNGWSRGKSG